MSTPARSQTPTKASDRARSRDASTAEPKATPSVTGKIATTSTAGSPAVRSKSLRTPGGSTPISARSAVRKPANGSSNATNVRNAPEQNGTASDDTKAQTAATIDELQERLRTAEKASEDFQKQITLLQTRIHDATDEQGSLEDTIQELNERIDELHTENKEGLRLRRELEAAYETARAAAVKSHDDAQAREDELTETIQRLRDNLAQKETPLTRSASFRGGVSPQPDANHFVPSSSLNRSDSRSSSRLVNQKDKIIESLRIELAEAQIKLIEMENMDGGKVQELEKGMMETRMANARLMEENESFQLLLSEKTLNGELTHSGLLQKDASTAAGSSLADELENVVDGEEGDGSRQYKLQIASLMDENKALTLYINTIISRVMDANMEHVLDKHADLTAPKVTRHADKDLPLPPPEKDEVESGFLARTRSMMGGRKPRPTSVVMPEPAPAPTAHENPDTAPSIPIGRSAHRSSSNNSNPNRRSVADWSSAGLVNSMYRGPSPTRRASGQLSPGLASPRNSFLGSRPSVSPRVPSGSTVPTISESEKSEVHRPNRDSKLGSSRNSVASDGSNSPPPSTAGGSDKCAGGNVMVGSKVRPLRLVQASQDEDAARKAANRASWMGWFNKGS